MKKLVAFYLITLALTAQSTSLPPNKLSFPDPGFHKTGISEEDFNKILNKINEKYAPIVASMRATLIIKKDWADPTVNAFADQNGTSWYLTFAGGMARHADMTVDGFTYVACHELGHHLGGYHFSSYYPGMANEGQSDYYAGHVCTPYLWRDDLDQNARAYNSSAAAVKSLCGQRYQDEAARNLCARIIVAGYRLAKMTGDIYRDSSQPDFASTDRSVVTHTDQLHPHGQCRLDTSIASALCTKAYDIGVIPAKGLGNTVAGEQVSFDVTCSEFRGDIVGARPKCWFKGLQ